MSESQHCRLYDRILNICYLYLYFYHCVSDLDLHKLQFMCLRTCRNFIRAHLRFQLLLNHPTPRLHVSRMAWAARTIRKRIPVQCNALHTYTAAVVVPRQAPQ